MPTMQALVQEVSPKTYVPTPQEEVASRMAAIGRGVVNPSDINFCLNTLSGWELQVYPEMQRFFEFSKRFDGKKPAARLVALETAICVMDGVDLFTQDERTRLLIPHETLSHQQLARLAMVDFIHENPDGGLERAERLSRIIGDISRPRLRTVMQELPTPNSKRTVKEEPEEVEEHEPEIKGVNIDKQAHTEAYYKELLSRFSGIDQQIIANIHLNPKEIADEVGFSTASVRGHVAAMSKEFGLKTKDFVLISVKSNASTLTDDRKMELKNKKIEGDLSDRQKQVFDCYINDLTDQQTADLFKIASSTVRTHINHISKILGGSGKKENTFIALLNGIDIDVSIPEDKTPTQE